MPRNRVMVLAAALGIAAWHADLQRRPDGTFTFVPVALAARSCSCPATYCNNGQAEGCNIECPSGEEAICVCTVFCDDNGKPSGINKCRCQPLESGQDAPRDAPRALGDSTLEATGALL
jgi:hypothetical protein